MSGEDRRRGWREGRSSAAFRHGAFALDADGFALRAVAFGLDSKRHPFGVKRMVRVDDDAPTCKFGGIRGLKGVDVFHVDYVKPDRKALSMDR